MKISQWVTLGLLACTSLAFEQRAEACSPPADGIYDSIPHNGEVYPANAALIFSGVGILLDRVKVTVDGVPAAFATPASVVKDVDTLSAVVTPEPMAGQTVVVQGSFCAPFVPPQGACAPFSLTYTAGPRDAGSLTGAQIESFDIYDYSDYDWRQGGCGDTGEFSHWLHIASPDQPSAIPLFYTIEAYRGKGLSDLAFKMSNFWPSDGRVEISGYKDTLKGASLPEALCFRVTTADAAGNVAAWSELVCEPCHYRIDPPTTPASYRPSEPAWSESDIYPGGSCDPGGTNGSSSSGGGGAGGSTNSTGSSNGNGGTAFGGCAFQSAGGVGSPTAQLSLLAFCAALAVSMRRRRRS